jgi:hypothetical protein
MVAAKYFAVLWWIYKYTQDPHKSTSLLISKQVQQHLLLLLERKRQKDKTTVRKRNRKKRKGT